MKTTINKLRNMGLNDEQIIKVFSWNETIFTMRKKYPNNLYEVEDLPLKVDLIVKGYDINDIKKVKLFDEIFKVNGLGKSKEDIKYKVDMISEFPKLLKNIKLSKINTEIGEKEDLKAKLYEQIAQIESEIQIKKNEVDILKGSMKLEKAEEPTIVETPAESSDKSFEECVSSITIAYKNGNLFLCVRTGTDEKFKENQEVEFKGKKYIIQKIKKCTAYLRSLENVVEEPPKPKRAEGTPITLTESDIRIDYVSKAGYNLCIRDKSMYDEVKNYKEVKIAKEGKINLYRVDSHNDRMKRINVTFIETILENKNYEQEKEDFKFW